MTFIDHRLNSRYRYGFVGGPRWKTLVRELRSGRNSRLKQWSMPHHEYIANYATFNEAEKAEMLNALMVTGGGWAAFRFKDWNDWSVESEPFGVGDGTSTPKQLTKTYTFGPSTFTRNITLPLNAAVMADGVPIAVTVDPLTGLVTPEDPWPTGDVLTWTGQFDVRVRFANDFNPFTSVASSIRELMVDLVEDFP